MPKHRCARFDGLSRPTTGASAIMTPVLTGLVLLAATAHFDDAPAGRPLEHLLLDEDPAALANAVREQGDPRAEPPSSISRR